MKHSLASHPMPIKLCIIGNSHVAALKVALRDRLFENSALDITFWGARGRTFFDVKYENGRLIAPVKEIALLLSAGKHETLDPNDFDVLVFHAAPLNQTRLFRSLFIQKGAFLNFSSSFLREGIYDVLDSSTPCQLIRQVRADFQGRILVLPQPLILEQSDLFGERSITSDARMVVTQIALDYFAKIGTEFLPQPTNTIVENKYTSAEYFIRSGDLRSATNPDTDYTHMNQFYGDQVLRAIAEKLNV